jgi:hypothetical protein
MQTIENQQEVGSVIHLDGKMFINCAYTNCKIVYSGGDYGWERTTFTNCEVSLAGAARRTMDLLTHFGIFKPQGGQQPLPQTFPSSGVIN